MGILGILGWLIMVIGVIWMVVTAIQTGQTTGEKALWGLVCFFCGILGGIIFFAVKRQGLVPLLLEIVGFVLMFLGGGLAAYTGGYGAGGPVTP
jgi:uncharacterized membrane protein YjjP (DUF1212 family)